MEYTPYIFERPVIDMQKEKFELFRDSIRLLIRRQKIKEEMTEMQVELIYTQLLLALGGVYKKRGEDDSPRYNRNQEIVKELVRIIVQYYKTERNVSFYAEKLHLSPQHLSTTVKKVTGKTLTDILSSFIIRDAQAKLRSTDMTVQEIAYSLNFSDISFLESILNVIRVCRPNSIGINKMYNCIKEMEATCEGCLHFFMYI